MIENVVVAGGGTGGHLFPGMSVVEELRRRFPDVAVTFIGTQRGIEARVLPARGERLELLDVRPLKGQGYVGMLRNAARVPTAAAEAARLLRRLSPELVLGVGGYASGPVLLAAAAQGLETALLEQNAFVGMTNRWLAPVCGRAYVAFDEAAAQLGPHKARVLGNPVRRTVVDAARAALADPEGFEARARDVLILGGSQGARALNRTVPEALSRLKLGGVRVIHQTGEAMCESVSQRYRELGIRAEVVPFIDDIARVYRNAAVVIARAGATTLAEICAIGRASVLVPYPHAADDHQTRNAMALRRLGAAACIEERALSPEAMANEVGQLLGDRDARQAMAEAARGHGKPDAAAAIVDDLLGWLPGASRPAKVQRAKPGAPPSGRGPSPFSQVDFARGRQGLRVRRAAPPPVHLELLAPARQATPTCLS